MAAAYGAAPSRSWSGLTLIMATVATAALVSSPLFLAVPSQLHASTTTIGQSQVVTLPNRVWVRDAPASRGTVSRAVPDAQSQSYVTGPANEAAANPSRQWSWAAMTAAGAALAFWVGHLVAHRQTQSYPMAMMSASGTEDSRSGEWDKRVSLMDQVQASQDLKYVSENDFGTLIMRFVQERYGEKETERVVQSIRRTERGEDFRKVHSPHRLMEQVATSYVEGLTALPSWPDPTVHHPWAKVVQDNWTTIRDDLEEALKMGEEGLREQGSISWMGAQGGADSYGTEWKTLGLCDRGYWDADNSRIFKNTCRILRKSRAPISEAFFAKMPAQTEIKPHSDLTNFVLTGHLGLKVPENKCWINVGDSKNVWSNGGMFLLDTTFMHEAFNTSDEDRYVLILRVWHPQLTATEIEAITFLFDCLDDSDIILHPDGLAMYDMMKAHRLMEWNAILGPGDTDEECDAMLKQMAESGSPALDEAASLAEMVQQKLKENATE